jgi:UDP-glucose 4-epimerase
MGITTIIRVMKNILVTGGAGYIGSHTVLALLDNGFEPVIVDNFSNSSPEVIKRLGTIAGKEIKFYEADLCNKSKLKDVFDKHDFDAAIHFAGYKAVGESVSKPMLYYHNNLLSTINLCELMQEYDVNSLVFSSSATVYGDPEKVPIPETAPIQPTNPYGHTKAIIEQMLRDLVAADKNVSVSLLRYFNPIGAHPSGQIGENPNGIPNNLLPYVAQVAVGKLDKVRVFGNDYDTPDGTGVRDYIHVSDIAQGHVAALRHMPSPGTCEAYNLGTGQGYSVLEVIEAFSKASGKEIPYEIVDRRPGDIATCYADPSKAERDLKWKATKTLEEACRDAWRWQSQSSTGFTTN